MSSRICAAIFADDTPFRNARPPVSAASDTERRLGVPGALRVDGRRGLVACGGPLRRSG